MFGLIIFKVIIVFVLGLIFGSFANVVVDREGKKNNNKKKDGGQRQRENFWKGRSRCDYCQKEIAWHDNIPLISYLILKGRCRHCGQKISWQYPVVELLFGISFVVIAWASGGVMGFMDKVDLITTIFYLAVSFILLTILVWDLKFMIIPDGLVVGGLILSVVYFGYQYLISSNYLMSIDTDLTRNVLGGLAVGGFFYLIFQFSQGRWVGGGDVKLGFLVGFLVGWRQSYLLLLLTYVLGSVPAIYLLLTGKATVKTKIPFGPFLVIACLAVMLWGDKLWFWWERMV